MEQEQKKIKIKVKTDEPRGHWINESEGDLNKLVILDIKLVEYNGPIWCDNIGKPKIK